MPTALWVTLAALYLLAFPYHPGLRSPNELSRLAQTRALYEYRTVALNQVLRTYGPVGDLSVRDGVYYPSKAPLLSFAAVPLYAGLSLLGGGHRYAVEEKLLVYLSRLFLTVLPTLALLWLLRRFLREEVSPLTADLVVTTYALGSLGFSYSLLFMSHQPAAVLAFLGWWSLHGRERRDGPLEVGGWRSESARARGWVGAGLLFGAAVTAEYTAALAVGIVVLHAGIGAWRREGLVRAASLARWLALGALPFVAFLLWYHWRCFGHPLDTGYKHLADVPYIPWHQGGFLGIKLPDARAFVLSFFSPLRGLFFLSPFLLLAPIGLWRSLRAGGEARAGALLPALLFLAFAYFTSSFSYDSWGWTTGPRHLTVLIPFLLAPVALELERLRDRPLLHGAAIGLCAASILATGLVTLVNYVPDVVSSPLFGLALPLFRDGYWPPTPLAVFTPTTAAPLGSLLIALVLAITITLAWLAARSTLARLATVAVLVATLSLHATFTRSDGDRGAQQHLRSIWLTRR